MRPRGKFGWGCRLLPLCELGNSFEQLVLNGTLGSPGGLLKTDRPCKPYYARVFIPGWDGQCLAILSRKKRTLPRS